jgi:hypothetical protein
MPVFERSCLPAATGCQFLSAVTSVRHRFRAALRQAKRLTVRGRYADFIAVSLLANVAMGHLRPNHSAPVPTNVGYASNSDQIGEMPRTTLSAKSGLMHCSKQPLYSITSSAIARTPDGMLRPSALAVLRLITNSNLVGCTTGRSAGLSPLRTRPT